MMPDYLSPKQRRRTGPKFRPTAIFDLMHEHLLTEVNFARAIGFRRRAVVAWMEGGQPPFAAVVQMAERFSKPLEWFIEHPKATTCSPPPATE